MSKTKRKKESNKILIPIILAMGFIPLIVHTYTYQTGYSQFEWFSEAADAQVDCFLICKAIAIVIVGALMLAILCRKYFAGKKKQFAFETSFYCLLAYAALVILSAVFSPYHRYVFKGAYEVFEPLWVVLAYLIFCYYTYQYVQTEEQFDFVGKWAGVGIVILTVLGVFQFIGLDFFKSTIGKMLISSPAYWDRLDLISFTFEPRVIYATLYNPDYLAFYFGMLIPVFAALFWSEKNKTRKIILGIVTILAVVDLIGSTAVSGIVALPVAVVFALYVLLSRNKKSFVGGLIAAVIALAALVIACATTPLGQKLHDLFMGTYKAYDSFAIQDIDTTDTEVVFYVNDKELHLSYVMDENGIFSVSCTDENGQQLETYVTGENNYTTVLTDSAYANCTVTPVYIDDYICLDVNMDGHDWYFTNETDGTYYYYNAMGKFVKYPEIEDTGLLNDDFFHNRGIIWNHTWPIVKHSIIFGSGANTYGLVYPQNDYIYREYMGTQYVYDVKAHCWFLQQWVENGLLAMLLLLAFYLWYFFKSLRLYRRADFSNRMTVIGFGIYTGTITYMIVSIANDSNVNTAPVFWILMGLGMAVNRIVGSQMTTAAAAGEAAEKTGSEKNIRKRKRR